MLKPLAMKIYCRRVDTVFDFAFSRALEAVGECSCIARPIRKGAVFSANLLQWRMGMVRV